MIDDPAPMFPPHSPLWVEDGTIEMIISIAPIAPIAPIGMIITIVPSSNHRGLWGGNIENACER